MDGRGVALMDELFRRYLLQVLREGAPVEERELSDWMDRCPIEQLAELSWAFRRGLPPAAAFQVMRWKHRWTASPPFPRPGIPAELFLVQFELAGRPGEWRSVTACVTREEAEQMVARVVEVDRRAGWRYVVVHPVEGMTAQ